MVHPPVLAVAIVVSTLYIYTVSGECPMTSNDVRGINIKYVCMHSKYSTQVQNSFKNWQLCKVY